jgi:amino acid permease
MASSSVTPAYTKDENVLFARGGVEKKEDAKYTEFSGLEEDLDAWPSCNSTKRKLKSRHIQVRWLLFGQHRGRLGTDRTAFQLIGIGGTIGTALYVQIGKALMRGGPASLFIGFTFW